MSNHFVFAVWLINLSAAVSGPVRGICFHSQQPLFVSGGDDYKIKVMRMFSVYSRDVEQSLNFRSLNYMFGFVFWSFDIRFQLALTRRRPFSIWSPVTT